ncbi:MAG: homocysteine S-methyltransferase family protein [Clostridia bacterium]|nr:homocysteine S-methyltransferase family protein [Clostridia bacterium]
MKLKKRLSRGMLLCDGSMGALLSSMGYGTPCPDELSVSHPDVIRDIHQAYLDAGADILIADCFGCTEPVLAHKGHAGKAQEFTRAAVRLAKEAAADKALVACDMGPTGEFIYPVGARSFEAVYGWYYEQACAARETGADFAFLETHTDLSECRAACLAAKEAGLEVIASCSVNEKSRLLTGASVQAFAVSLGAAGATALGLNCSLGPEQLLNSLNLMRGVSPLPIAVQPNAGLPVTAADGSVSYPYGPDQLEEGMRAIVQAGASIIGGCCGTTPEHIRRLKPLCGALPESKKEKTEYLCSARECFAAEDALTAPESISDPEDAYDVDEDSTVIEISAEEFTPEMLLELAANTKLPVLLNASEPEKAEALLRVYPGRMAVKGCPEAAAKYGAYIV